MKRGQSASEIKRLFAASGGRCAFADCTTNLVTESGAILAEIAHITASSPGGPRFDPVQTEKQRHGFENLILLCPTQHALIDTDPRRYDARALREMKALHERKIRQRLNADVTDRCVLEPAAAKQLARQVDPSVADVA